jgi:hypothetical protein
MLRSPRLARKEAGGCYRRIPNKGLQSHSSRRRSSVRSRPSPESTIRRHAGTHTSMLSPAYERGASICSRCCS